MSSLPHPPRPHTSHMYNINTPTYTQCDSQISLIKAAAQALVYVYSHLVTKHYSWIVPAGARGAGTPKPPRDDDVTARYRDWMRENYVFCLEKLQELTNHQHKAVQVGLFSLWDISIRLVL